MKRFTIAITGITALGIFALGCGDVDEGQYNEATQTAKMVCASATTAPIVVGNKVAGKILVRNDKNKLYVTFIATYPGATFDRTRFAVTNKIKDLWKPWKWRYKNSHKKGTKKFTRVIKLKKGWKVGKTLYIAGYFRLKYNNKMYHGWVKGGYMKYKVGECYLDAVLPTGNVDMYVKSSSSYSRLILNLKNVGDSFDVWDGAWPGWCVEKTVYIRVGKWYSRQLVSSQDTANLPDRAKNVNWQMVNYMINNKDPKASTTDIQNAIWHVLGYIPMPTDADAKKMIAKAKKFGKNFRPTYGDSVAVIYLSASGVQLVFLEVVL